MSGNVGSRAFQNARLQKKFKKQAETLLPAAMAAYRQGRYGETQALCRQVLSDLPDHFDALHLLGVSELDCLRFEEAAAVLGRAVKILPGSAQAHSNLGLAYFKLKRYDDACRCQERAIALNPNFPTALTNLGNVLMRLKRYDAAVEAHERAIRLKPDYADAHCNRGMALLLTEMNTEADQSFDRALSLQPRHLQAMVGKGMVSLHLRHYAAAQRAFDMALAIKPDFAEIIAHRGRLHMQLGRYDEAEADFDAAIALDPTLEFAWERKAHFCLFRTRITQAIHACHKALELNPDSEYALASLGACHASQGDIATALQFFDRALAAKPDFGDAVLKKIFAMDFVPGADFAAHQAVRREWWERIGARIPRRALRHSNRDPEKRLVIGYVSSDFRGHSAALAFMPVIRHHDRAAFEIVAYSCSPLTDAITEQSRSLVDRWIDASVLSDDELADRVEADGVDILVDLSGHSGGHRLTVFAGKPAPVQVSAWGSATGTGLPTMDYLFADPVLIPDDVRHLFAEQVHDLPCAITIDAGSDIPSVESPALRNDYVTFGVFNRIDKISDEVLALWSKLLGSVERSHILIKNGALDDPFLRDGLVGRFVACGVPMERVTCIGSTPRPEHLAAFADIDISLDPFPQNGGISTWESLQMGVPVISKLGLGASSRIGGAILKSIGLDDWVAEDDAAYLAIAQRFAAQPAALQSLRAELPARVAASAAGNGERYTRQVEAAYRQFWRCYCAAAA